MAKKLESRLQKKIQEHLKSTVGGWWFKVWGGPFMPAGIPDLIGCVHGMFFALEVKTHEKGSEPSAIQLEVISRIVLEGGGVATVVRTPEEAAYVVNRALAEATRSLRVRLLKAGGRTAMRAAYRQDLHHYEADEAPDPGVREGGKRARRAARRPTQ